MVLGDTERSRAIYELAITQPRLDMPELVWKSYLDSEISSGNLDYARKLYRRLLEVCLSLICPIISILFTLISLSKLHLISGLRCLYSTIIHNGIHSTVKLYWHIILLY